MPLALRNTKSYFEKQNKKKNFLRSSLGELLVSPTLVEHSADHLQSRGTFLPQRSTPLLISDLTLLKASFCMRSYLVNVYSPVQINCSPVNTKVYGHEGGILSKPRQAALNHLLRFSFEVRLMV